MKVIVFDTETTGLPSANLSLDMQPHVCQFAAVSYECDLDSKSLNEISRIDLLIKPPVLIDYETSSIHGITNDIVANSPSFRELVDEIVEAFYSSDVAVAHNLSFDKQIIGYELERLNRSKDFLPDQIFDTMKETKNLCQLPGRFNKYKSPKLLELYQFLFDEKFKGAHNALHDVLATGKCLEELLRRGIFQPEEPIQNSLF